MSRDDAHPLPAKDPIGGGPLVITEMQAVESGITIRGRFEVPRFARLSGEQARYLETFLKCRGMLNSVERELGISYPTARARLDAVLKALDLHAVREDAGPSSSSDAPSTPDVSAPSAEETPDLMEWEPGEPEGGDSSFDAPTGDALRAEEEAAPEVEPEPETPRLTRDEILSMLERGEIGVDEVKKELERAR